MVSSGSGLAALGALASAGLLVAGCGMAPTLTPTPIASPVADHALIPSNSATATRLLGATPTPTLAPPQTSVASERRVVTVHADRGTVRALVADTADLRARGLSGLDQLAHGWGMWFEFDTTGSHVFWMRGMRFSIDIIWMDAGLQVVHIVRAAPVPPTDAASADLPRYAPSGGNSRYVLEIAAGSAEELGIDLGDVLRVVPAD